MKWYFIVTTLFAMFGTACSTKSDDRTQTIQKDGSIETEISVTHLDANTDLLTTKHTTWIAGINTKNIVHTDTIASLGYKKEEAVNEEDETMEVSIPKDYEIYITVK